VSAAREWSEQGLAHAADGRLDAAARCFAASIEGDARHADGWHNLGNALRQLGLREAAFTALRNALLLEPGRAQTYLVLGNLLVETGKHEDALECFERAARHDPSLARARSRLADQMSARGRVRRAERLFRQSLGLDPDHIEGWLGLARTLEDVGDAAGARDAYANVLRRRPDSASALGAYLALLPAGEAAAPWRVRAGDALAAVTTSDEAKALVGYGLAKHYDRCGDRARAAQAAATANAARRRTSGALDRTALEERVERIIATYTAEFFAARRRFGVGNGRPVFIVGLPRSGTTLTEQLLAAHPLLHGAGELADLARLAEAGADIDADDSRVLAGEYLRTLQAGAAERKLRCIDKAPLNFLHLGFAALLFPNARVIHCRRSPRDTALSIWLENFNAEQRYATDFEDLAFFAAQYQRLMAHWRAVLPLPMLDVRYEDTVADLEREARRLVAFLGAPWDARCLAFHTSARAVQTPSRWQVREPLYTRSVGRWRNYAEHLPSLLDAFPA
jgi:tetratricopeptide (TPR) repeat protein